MGMGTGAYEGRCRIGDRLVGLGTWLHCVRPDHYRWGTSIRIGQGRAHHSANKPLMEPVPDSRSFKRDTPTEPRENHRVTHLRSLGRCANLLLLILVRIVGAKPRSKIGWSEGGKASNHALAEPNTFRQ
jgi:hypothetical protein